jgi:hypothetical protein
MNVQHALLAHRWGAGSMALMLWLMMTCTQQSATCLNFRTLRLLCSMLSTWRQLVFSVAYLRRHLKWYEPPQNDRIHNTQHKRIEALHNERTAQRTHSMHSTLCGTDSSFEETNLRTLRLLCSMLSTWRQLVFSLSAPTGHTLTHCPHSMHLESSRSDSARKTDSNVTIWSVTCYVLTEGPHGADADALPALNSLGELQIRL